VEQVNNLAPSSGKGAKLVVAEKMQDRTGYQLGAWL
jgi:hypothetical protein